MSKESQPPQPKRTQVREDLALNVGALRCPYCHEGVAPADPEKQACNLCMAWHHAACWSELGRCAVCKQGAHASREVASREDPRAVHAKLVAVVVLALLALSAIGIASYRRARLRAEAEALMAEAEQRYREESAGPGERARQLPPAWIQPGLRYVLRDYVRDTVETAEVTRLLEDGARPRVEVQLRGPSGAVTSPAHVWTSGECAQIASRATRVREEQRTFDGREIRCAVYWEDPESGEDSALGRQYWIAIDAQGEFAFPGVVLSMDASGEFLTRLEAIEGD